MQWWSRLKINFCESFASFDFRLLQHYPPDSRHRYADVSEIAAELFALGHANSNGIAFSKSSIKSHWRADPAGDFAALEA